MNTDAEKMERLANCAKAASMMCNAVPGIAEDFDADVGTTALILCGFLASKIVGTKEDGCITREEFFAQMDNALNVIGDAPHPTEQ